MGGRGILTSTCLASGMLEVLPKPCPPFVETLKRKIEVLRIRGLESSVLLELPQALHLPLCLLQPTLTISPSAAL